jgi:hypothetical protein
MTDHSDIKTAFKVSTDPDTSKHCARLTEVAIAKSIDCLREREANTIMREALEEILQAPRARRAAIAAIALEKAAALV